MTRPRKPSFPEWVETWLLPYIDDLALWPVLVALMGHVVVLLGPLLLLAWRTRHPAVYLVVFVLLTISAHICHSERQYRGKQGGITVVVALLWLAAAGLAAICERTQIL